MISAMDINHGAIQLNAAAANRVERVCFDGATVQVATIKSRFVLSFKHGENWNKNKLNL